jgi:DNA polymerase-1
VQMIVDGNNLVNRAYQGMSRGGAVDVSVADIITSVLRVIKQHDASLGGTGLPTVVFDGKGGSDARRAIYPGYKAGRAEKVAHIASAIDALARQRHLLESVRIDGHEADDVIATIATNVAATGGEVVILTSDYDLLQALDAGIMVRRIGARAGEWYDNDTETFERRWRFAPALFADYKALVGDNSDTIPGVMGIGPAYAGRLLREIGGIDDIYRNIWRVWASKVKHLLEAGEEDARRYLRVTTLDRNVPGVIGVLS